MASRLWGSISRRTKPSLTPIFVLFLLIKFAILLLEVPTIRLFERAACRRYYRYANNATATSTVYDVDESACKISTVQDLLATVVGWKMSFDALPGLLTAIYYGSIADRQGRHFVLLLCCLGLLLMLLWIVTICYFDSIFPVQVAWISSIFLFLGGGPRVFTAVTVAFLADSLQHSQRTSYLFVLSSLPHLIKLISPRTAAALMARSVFLPFLVSFTIITACTVLIWVKGDPERPGDHTLYHPIESTEPSSSSYRESSSDVYGSENLRQSNDMAPAQKYDNPFNSLVSSLQDLTTRARLLLQSPAIRFCFSTFYFKSVAMASESFIFQYASEKFGWSLRETTWLRIALASGALFVTLIACPLVATTLIKRGVPAHTLDLNAIRISLFLLVGFFFAAWRSTSGLTLILSMLGCGLGEGLEPALQGFITFLADEKRTAQLFALVAMCDTIGELTGGPIAAKLMAIGRKSGQASKGYCFLASSIIFGALGVAACTIGPERRKGDEAERRQELGRALEV